LSGQGTSKDDDPDWRNDAAKYFKQKAQLELYSGLEGMRGLKFNRQQHQKNREAEESYVRENVWNYKEGAAGDDEMAEEFVNFGEININSLPSVNVPTKPTPEPPEPPEPPPAATKPNGNKAWQTLLAASVLSLAAGGAGSAIGYLMRDDPGPTVVPVGGADFDFRTRLPDWMEEGE
jgi:hypothetical protein